MRRAQTICLPKWYFNTCMYIMPVLVVVMVGYWLLQTKEWFPDTWLNPFIIQDDTGTVLLQFGVVIVVDVLRFGKFFNRKTAKGRITKEVGAAGRIVKEGVLYDDGCNYYDDNYTGRLHWQF